MEPERRMGRPKTGVTPIRHIRVGDAWDEAAAIAEARGEKMSDVIRRAIDTYIRRHRHELAAGAKAGAVITPPPAQRRQSYSERKPYTVAGTLDDLTGPTSGVVTLPHDIDWSGTPTWDLDVPGMLAELYKTVLNEAVSVDQLNAYLNRDKLIELWPTLWLPPKVRRLWTERFPELPAGDPRHQREPA